MSEKAIFRISGIIAGISGLVILAGVFLPIISHEIDANQKYPTLLSPLVQNQPNPDTGVVDYTKASNWFTGDLPQEDFKNSGVDYFTLSIPKLRIENATVAIGGEDLSKSLVQYPGTALPGKNGTAVIFGHSILPLFYDPKDYMAIFSTLPTLKSGDEIFINYDGVSYKFRVEEITEAYPTDFSVLAQDSTDSFISLVTCTPPGDPRKPKRLIVKAREVPFLGDAIESLDHSSKISNIEVSRVESLRNIISSLPPSSLRFSRSGIKSISNENSWN